MTLVIFLQTSSTAQKKKSEVFYSIPGNYRFGHMNWRNP